jgi:hypothetical protein
MATVPVWNRWTDTDGESVAAFQDGKRAQTENQTADALAAYRRAIELDPRNANARFALASAYEASGTEESAFLAFIEYVELVALWPNHLEGRYRLAASLAFASTWIHQWNAAEMSLRRRLMELFDETRTDHVQYAPVTVTDFQRRAVRQLQAMQRQLRWRSVLWRWITTGDDLGDYELRLLGLTPGSVRTRYLALIESAKIATRVQIGDANLSELRPIETHNWWYWRQQVRLPRRPRTVGSGDTPNDSVLWIRYQASKARQLPGRVPWLSMGMDWRLRYNVACVLSRSTEGDPGRRQRYIDEAVDQLILVARDRSVEPPTTKLRSVLMDPDFAPIKDSPRFRSWVATLDVGSAPTGPADPSPTPQRAAQILASWSSTRAATWMSRFVEMKSWSGAQLISLHQWFGEELVAAERLARWATVPADEEYRKSFWAAVSTDKDGKVADEALPEVIAFEPLNEARLLDAWNWIGARASQINARANGFVLDLGEIAMTSGTVDPRWAAELVLQSRSDWVEIEAVASQLSRPAETN